MKLLILASGSEGNSLYVGEGNTGIIIDAGISRRRIIDSLRAHYIRPENVRGLFITHEHFDHIRGLEVLLKHHNIPVYASPGTAQRVQRRIPGIGIEWFFLSAEMGDFRISAVPLPHDAAEPMGFVIETGTSRLLVATDLGFVPDNLKEEISKCSAAVIESNHDVDMLINGSYPEDLKRRILSRYGHLSNRQCAAALRRSAGENLKLVILAHLSRENNNPDTALVESSNAMTNGAKIVVANRDIPTGPFYI